MRRFQQRWRRRFKKLGLGRLLPARDRPFWRPEAQMARLDPRMHVPLCIAATVLACGLLVLLGAHRPAATYLHRWFPSVFAAFLVLFAGAMSLALRGWIGRTPWAVLVGALLGFPVAALAFHLCFAVLEFARWRASGAITPLPAILYMTLLLGPTVSLAWLFGAVAAALFLVLRRLARAVGIGTVKA